MMTTQMYLLKYCLFAEIIAVMTTLVFMARKSLLGKFYALTAFLVVMGASDGVDIATLYFRKQLGISKLLDYNIFAMSTWICSGLEYCLMLLIIYGVFRQAMKPLEGLHRAGKIVFRWVAGVSIALVFGMSLGQHTTGVSYVASVTGQIQQGVSILTLCLLIFVCLSTRYLGLTYRSHIFGASLGLGIFATGTLVQTAWFSNGGAQSPYSPVYLFSAFGALATLLTWGTYFALPEPKRQMILLPTTSPYFLWNSISEALGDEPGFVAIAGFTPDMLAPAEMTMLTESSKRLRERDLLEQAQMDSLLGSGSSSYPSLALNQ